METHLQEIANLRPGWYYGIMGEAISSERIKTTQAIVDMIKNPDGISIFPTIHGGVTISRKFTSATVQCDGTIRVICPSHQTTDLPNSQESLAKAATTINDSHGVV